MIALLPPLTEFLLKPILSVGELFCLDNPYWLGLEA
jgi:hypothetical protein